MKRRTLLTAALAAALVRGATAPTNELNKMLLDATRSGDIQRVKHALDGGADVC